jgi:hypothetical protein
MRTVRPKNCLLLFLVAVVVAIAVRQTYAVWVENQLTPKTAISDWISFKGLPELEESERIILEVLNEQKDVSVKFSTNQGGTFVYYTEDFEITVFNS